VFQTVVKSGIAPSDMLGYKYLEALPAVAAGDANKLLLLPSGASNAMGAIAGLGAALATGGEQTPEGNSQSGRRPRPGAATSPKPADGDGEPPKA
jgi:hypothetical protein